MLYTEGNLRAEDAYLRSIARSKVHSALAELEAKITRLVEQIVKTIDINLTRKYTIDRLFEFLQNHHTLRPEQSVITRYTIAFPELEERASYQQSRAFEVARRRIEEAIRPFEDTRRFAHTTGLHS